MNASLLVICLLGALPASYKAPAGIPITPASEAWGRELFFERACSANFTISCADCHRPEDAYASPDPVAIGISNRPGKLNVPTLLATSSLMTQFRNGRAIKEQLGQIAPRMVSNGTRLDAMLVQASGPLTNPDEMGDQKLEDVERRIKSIPKYQNLCRLAYGQDVSILLILHGLVSFQQTLYITDMPIYRRMRGDMILTETGEKAYHRFNQSCVQCHAGPFFTSGEFANNGMAYLTAGKGFESTVDRGRFDVLTAEQNRFMDRRKGYRNSMMRAQKVPTLQGTVGPFNSAPYGHTGFFSYDNIFTHYNRGGKSRSGRVDPYLDPRIKPLNLTPQELAEFKVGFIELFTPISQGVFHITASNTDGSASQ